MFGDVVLLSAAMVMIVFMILWYLSHCFYIPVCPWASTIWTIWE